MAWKQKVSPNVNVPGYSGGCLAYVDDGVNPSQRQPTAQASWYLAVNTGVAHSGQEPPLNVWVPVYYTIDNGPWAGYGHVAWFYSNGKDTLIYDSEFGCGNRTGPYANGQELFNYMGWQMSYLGWSEAVDGLRIVENVEEKPVTSDNSNNIEIKGDNLMKFIQITDGTYKNNQVLITPTSARWVTSGQESQGLQKLYGLTKMDHAAFEGAYMGLVYTSKDGKFPGDLKKLFTK